MKCKKNNGHRITNRSEPLRARFANSYTEFDPYRHEPEFKAFQKRNYLPVKTLLRAYGCFTDCWQAQIVSQNGRFMLQRLTLPFVRTKQSQAVTKKEGFILQVPSMVDFGKAPYFINSYIYSPAKQSIFRSPPREISPIAYKR